MQQIAQGKRNLRERLWPFAVGAEKKGAGTAPGAQRGENDAVRCFRADARGGRRREGTF